MFGRKRALKPYSARPKIGDVRIYVEQIGTGRWSATVQQLQFWMSGFNVYLIRKGYKAAGFTALTYRPS